MIRSLLLLPFFIVSLHAAEPPSFRNDIEPILTRAGCNSGACHGALAGKGGFKLSLRAYDPESDYFVTTRQALVRRVNAAQPEESLLLLKASATLKHGGGVRLPENSDHYRIVRDWIAAGAPGPKNSDARLTRLSVTPTAIILKPGETVSLSIQATYSDGRTADVTNLARYTSSNDPVATVNDKGIVMVAGAGEAGISVQFGTQVATMFVTSPYPHPLPESAFTQARSVNFIDEFVLKKLKELNLDPSPVCTDAEFIRRVYLDTCGILPTPDEVASLLANRAADKRAKLIDTLLERPEYVDYWSHKWSDLLLVSSRKLSQPAMWSYYRFVRKSVADNQPWDEFARDLLLSSGSTLKNGGGNYFVIHKDVTDLVESTTVTFLGLSINCARCHNHALEKWTQDQYFSMANLFARVGLKNGSRADEVLVQSLPAGEVLHLRRGVPMPPTPLDGTPLPLDSNVDRREYFVEWLTNPKNPFFAKAIVNRVWQNYLGRGLVEAVDDLRETNPPSHRELFDALTQDFITHKFDLKHLMRMILNSATYQRSARPTKTNTADDRYYSHALLRRLSAETILDAYSDITGVPTRFDLASRGRSAGAPQKVDYPLGTRAMQLPDSMLISRFLDSFGRAEREQTCACERTDEANVGQALHLNNGSTLNEKLHDANSQLSEWLKSDWSNKQVVRQIFLLALSRPPTEKEENRFVEILAEATNQGASARREALEDVCWAILTSNEFLFNH